MANEIDEKVESPEDVEDIEEKDDTDWKAEALKFKELAGRNAGIAKRNATRLEKLRTMKVEVPVEKKEEKKQGFDNAEKAYLRASGIKSSEYELVQKYVDAGKSLDDVLDEDSTVGKLFQAELKDSREARATKEAIPSGSKRSAPAARDTVEYWLGKGELPPREQTELRRKVVNARLKQDQAKSQFTDNPVV